MAVEIRYSRIEITANNIGTPERIIVPCIVTGLIHSENMEDTIESQAILEVANTLPTTYEGLPRQVISVDDKVGDNIVFIDVEYNQDTASDTDSPFKAMNGNQYFVSARFSSREESENRKISYNRSITPAIGFTMNEMDVAKPINEQEDGADGVDIQTSSLTMTETYSVPRNLITPAYIARLTDCLNCTNMYNFYNFDVGSVMFTAFDCERTSKNGKCTLTLTYSIRKKETGIQIQGFSGTFDKNGFDYMWVYRKEVSKDNKVQRVPIGLYTERLYDVIDMPSIQPGI